MKKNQLRAELDRMASAAGVRMPEISRISGIPYSTLWDHHQRIEKMTVGDLLAWLEACGEREILIRR